MKSRLRPGNIRDAGGAGRWRDGTIDLWPDPRTLPLDSASHPSPPQHFSVTHRPILLVGSDEALIQQTERRLSDLGYPIAVPAPDVVPEPVDTVVLRACSDVEADAAPDAGEPDHPAIAPSFTDREVRAVVAMARSRHEAAQAVRDAEAFFFVAIDLFCFLDFNGYFKRLNPAWERTLGFSREELMSRPFIEFVHPDDRERTLAQNAAVRAGGQAMEFENRYLCKDGSHRWFLWNATPFTAGRVVYSVARDITPRKRAEAEKERLRGELADSKAEVKALRAILPMCSYCRKIRDDEDCWHSVEGYIATQTTSRFSHGICPDCMGTHHPEEAEGR